MRVSRAEKPSRQPSVPTTARTGGRSGTPCHTLKGPRIAMHWSDPAVITSIILVGITLVYVVVTALIWHATWQNTKATRQLLEASLRPYVGIVSVKFNENAPGFASGNLPVTIKNVGTVPALGIDVDVQFVLSGIADSLEDAGRSI